MEQYQNDSLKIANIIIIMLTENIFTIIVKVVWKSLGLLQLAGSGDHDLVSFNYENIIELEYILFFDRSVTIQPCFSFIRFCFCFIFFVAVIIVRIKLHCSRSYDSLDDSERDPVALFPAVRSRPQGRAGGARHPGGEGGDGGHRHRLPGPPHPASTRNPRIQR